MMSLVVQGYVLGLAYAMPIGAQNLFVINSAARQSKWEAIRTALIVAAMDVSLGVACVLGVGQLIRDVHGLEAVMGLVGGAFMIWLGLSLIVRKVDALHRPETTIGASVLRTAFVLTWLNPHALVDGSILLGGFQTTLSQGDIVFFIAGMSLASVSWFLSLTAIVNRFRDALSPSTMGRINWVCGAVLLLFGIKLGFGVLHDVW